MGECMDCEVRDLRVLFCVRLERMFVFGVRHYSPNTIYRHYSSARSAMIVRCGLRGTKFGSFACACIGVCMCVVGACKCLRHLDSSSWNSA